MPILPTLAVIHMFTQVGTYLHPKCINSHGSIIIWTYGPTYKLAQIINLCQSIITLNRDSSY